MGDKQTFYEEKSMHMSTHERFPHDSEVHSAAQSFQGPMMKRESHTEDVSPFNWKGAV